MAEDTKRALAAALEKKMGEKPLEKITISDLTDLCGINRQTFYYHFHDIYELVEWIYYTGISQALKSKRNYSNWQDGVLEVFEFFRKKKTFVERTYHSLSKSSLERFLGKMIFDMNSDIITEITPASAITESQKEFIARFYTYPFVGLTLDWIDNGMVESPQSLIDKADIVMKGAFLVAIGRFAKHGR